MRQQVRTKLQDSLLTVEVDALSALSVRPLLLGLALAFAGAPAGMLLTASSKAITNVLLIVTTMGSLITGMTLIGSGIMSMRLLPQKWLGVSFGILLMGIGATCVACPLVIHFLESPLLSGCIVFSGLASIFLGVDLLRISMQPSTMSYHLEIDLSSASVKYRPPLRKYFIYCGKFLSYYIHPLDRGGLFIVNTEKGPVRLRVVDGRALNYLCGELDRCGGTIISTIREGSER